MTTRDTKDNLPPEVSVGTRRKVYEAPRILSREPLEVFAATCAPPAGKASFGAGGQCTLFTNS